jgi:hypothetical protein
MECSLGRLDCLIEFTISALDSMAAVKVAKNFDVATPVALRTKTLRIAVPDGVNPDGPTHPLAVYPYIWKFIPETNTIQMEMGRDMHGKRVVALFGLRPQANRFGITVHISVYIVDEELAKATGIDYSMASRHSIDTRYHLEANKHFLFLLLGRKDEHATNNYTVLVPDELPPPPDDFDEIDAL